MGMSRTRTYDHGTPSSRDFIQLNYHSIWELGYGTRWNAYLTSNSNPFRVLSKGCAGVEPASTQRVSPRLLPLAIVYTTEFHPNGHGKTRTCIPGSWCAKHNNLDDFRLLYDMTILIYELEGDTTLIAERRRQTYSSSYIFCLYCSKS